jgi:hypothetical protein
MRDGRPVGHTVENGPTFFEACAIAATALGCEASAMSVENIPVNDVSPDEPVDVWRHYNKPGKGAKKRKVKGVCKECQGWGTNITFGGVVFCPKCKGRGGTDPEAVEKARNDATK